MAERESERSAVAHRFRRQAAACARLGSALYAALLARAADDIEASGPASSVLSGQRLTPGSAPALRLMGAVHRMVLEGRAPQLARYYPSAGGAVPADAGAAWPAFRGVLEAHGDELRRRVQDAVQTNEPGRSAALLGGFAVAAQRTGMPLRILEIGTSAGLNLRFDRFAYETGDEIVGDRTSPLVLRLALEGGAPPLDAPIAVIERAGCDPRPLDPTTDEGQLTLKSYVWPDQVDRLQRLDAAVEVARRVPAQVDAEPAGAWLRRRLAVRSEGAATVVFHSIVMQYLDEPERAAVEAAITDAAPRATTDAPLARLAMEPDGDLAAVRLTSWPGGDEQLLAWAGYHGRPIRWLARR